MQGLDCNCLYHQPQEISKMCFRMSYLFQGSLGHVDVRHVWLGQVDGGVEHEAIRPLQQQLHHVGVPAFSRLNYHCGPILEIVGMLCCITKCRQT